MRNFKQLGDIALKIRRRETRYHLTQQFSGFLFGSVLNFLISYLTYALLCAFIHYQFAYCIAYAVGITWSYWFNATHVFRVTKTLRSFCIYPSVYLAQYAASSVVLWFVVEQLCLPSLAAPLITAAVTLPVTYALSKLILQNNTNSQQKLDKNGLLACSPRSDS